VPAAPAVRVQSVESTRVVTTGHRNTRHFLRNGFNGFLRALPGDRAFLPPSPVRYASDITSVRCEASSLVMRRHCHQVDASVGASEPHDFAVRIRALRLTHSCVHRIPHPTSVTIAIRPFSREQDSCGYAGDLAQTGSGIFLRWGMDRQSADLPAGRATNHPHQRGRRVRCVAASVMLRTSAL
jgi:hypothetical protein